MDLVILLQGVRGFYTCIDGKIYFPDKDFMVTRMGLVSDYRIVNESTSYGFIKGTMSPTEEITADDIKNNDLCTYFDFVAKMNDQYFAVFQVGPSMIVQTKINGKMETVHHFPYTKDSPTLTKAEHSYWKFRKAVYNALKPLEYRLEDSEVNTKKPGLITRLCSAVFGGDER